MCSIFGRVDSVEICRAGCKSRSTVRTRRVGDHLSCGSYPEHQAADRHHNTSSERKKKRNRKKKVASTLPLHWVPAYATPCFFLPLLVM